MEKEEISLSELNILTSIYTSDDLLLSLLNDNVSIYDIKRLLDALKEINKKLTVTTREELKWVYLILQKKS